ncbi:DNA/RNA non-specific endonuclease [Microlunatus ginsengisoli]|uniref:DNA/RNA non-specific endonuclease n=1 Tax=Microlunatus ginsengisoli TaxID=363863 RepID=A0ABP6ZP68_9ACTN
MTENARPEEAAKARTGQSRRAEDAVPPKQLPGGTRTTPFAAGYLGAPAILALQAAVGNRAVGRIVAANTGPSPVRASLTKETIGTSLGRTDETVLVRRMAAASSPSPAKTIGPLPIGWQPARPGKPAQRSAPTERYRRNGDHGWLREDSPPPLQHRPGADHHAPSPGGPTVQPITVQRQHNNNWFNYIDAYRIQHGLPKKAKWNAATAAAAKLDFAGDRVANPAMALTTIPAAGLKPAYVGEMDTIRAFLGVKPAGAQHSTFNYGPTNAQGFATWMKATLLPTPAGGTAIVGSAPSTWAGDWNRLRKRRQKDLSSVFVRGHLLHDTLGGPGLDYNLAPLTNVAKGNWGANHANWQHRFGAEAPMLGYQAMMQAPVPLISKVEYEVKVVYGAHGRANQIGKLNNVQVAYNLALTQLGGAPSHTKTKKKMIANKVAYAPGSDAWEAIEEAVNAHPKELATNVDQRLKDNHALWVFEDANVPIQFDATWTATPTGGGGAIAGGPVTAKNVLPQTIDAFYQ